MRRAADRLLAAGNGAAYMVFVLIGLVVLAFLVRWALAEYWIDTHCTLVLGTRVCR